ncbi:MAG: hypothetical protein ABIF85_04130 [Nanoarchaeota archaeon]|nr:hypothetical protein [Nanoarchaeota archaeon]MBU4300327.1 hypothetical protein [Nanoarchaeota archaeon]MBU4452602.1 hypothetical protein [Nanoarchaeota archaeon]MCG2723554.1 hypothetical protein [archaeon]
MTDELRITNYRGSNAIPGSKAQSYLNQLVKNINQVRKSGTKSSTEIVVYKPPANSPNLSVQDSAPQEKIVTVSDPIRYPSEVSLSIHSVYHLPNSSQMAFLIEFEKGINPFNAVPFNVAKFLPKGGRKAKVSLEKGPKEIYLELVARVAKEALSGKWVDTLAYDYDMIKKEITEDPKKAIFIYSPNN